MAEDKIIRIKKETLEKIAHELGFPIDQINFEKLLSDAVPLFVRYLQEMNKGNKFYIGREVNDGLMNFRHIDFEKYLLEYLIFDRETQN